MSSLFKTRTKSEGNQEKQASPQERQRKVPLPVRKYELMSFPVYIFEYCRYMTWNESHLMMSISLLLHVDVSGHEDWGGSWAAGRPDDGDAELLVGRHHPPVSPSKELEHGTSDQSSQTGCQVEASVQARQDLLGTYSNLNYTLNLLQRLFRNNQKILLFLGLPFTYRT